MLIKDDFVQQQQKAACCSKVAGTAGNLPEEHPPYDVWCSADDDYLLLKASALVSTITVLDLMGHARTVFSRSYDLWVYGGATILYILLTAVLTLMAFVIRRYWFQSLPSDPWFKGLSR